VLLCIHVCVDSVPLEAIPPPPGTVSTEGVSYMYDYRMNIYENGLESVKNTCNN
jgi:hypothetical protein